CRARAPRSRLRSRRLSATLARMARASIVALALALLLGSVGPARAEIFGNTHRSADFGVEITVPRGFALSEQRSDPGLLVRAYEHTTGARLSLAAQRLRAGESARDYVERNVGGLRKLNYKIGATTTSGTGAIIVDGTTPDGKRAIRQAYTVQN